MAETKAPDGRGVVVACALLLGVEAHALADDCGLRAVRAPDGEGHLEAHGEDAMGGELGGAVAEGVFVVELVAGGGAFEVGGDVASHVEALHGGRVLLVFASMCVCLLFCFVCSVMGKAISGDGFLGGLLVEMEETRLPFGVGWLDGRYVTWSLKGPWKRQWGTP